MDKSEARAKIIDYIERNPLGVLGTTNDDGTPHGAAVYVCTLGQPAVYFVTKDLTQKYINLTERPSTTITIANERESSSLQAAGQAKVVNNPALLEMITKKIKQAHAIRAEWLPPLEKLRAGGYAVIGIDLTQARLAEFRGLDIGGEDIFIEL